MFFDSVAIIVCVLLVLLAVSSSVSAPFFRKIHADEERSGSSGMPPVSVIVISDNNARELEANLPAFLSQDYPAGYEVIVVVDRDEDGTGDVLKTFGGRPNLYSTFVPDSSRYMSRRKLAITLGVKAAKNDWILLTDATCRPVSDRWILSMSAARGGDASMVIGYSGYSAAARHFQIFHRFRSEYSFLREAASGRAYATAGNNLMFSKGMFMAGNGFQGNLKYLRGEYEFLVNKYASHGRVAVDVSHDGYIVDKAPSRKGWHDRNVFYVETRRHLSGSFKHRMAFIFDMFSLHACFLVSLASGVFAAVSSRWVILPVACLALFVPLVVRLLGAKRAMKAFSVDVPLFKVIPYEFRIVWHNLKSAIAYRFADKYDFISHKS